MDEEADCVAQDAVAAKRAVAGLMSEDPEAHAGDSNHERIENGTEEELVCRMVNLPFEIQSGRKRSGQEGDILDDVGQRSNERRLEAMLRYGFPKLVDSNMPFHALGAISLSALCAKRNFLAAVLSYSCRYLLLMVGVRDVAGALHHGLRHGGEVVLRCIGCGWVVFFFTALDRMSGDAWLEEREREREKKKVG